MSRHSNGSSKGQGTRWTSRVSGLIVGAGMLTVLIAGPLAGNSPAGSDRPEMNMATITTSNVPDGRCHEDNPCWTGTINDGRK